MCVMQIYAFNKLSLLQRCSFCENQELILIIWPNSKHPLSVLKINVCVEFMLGLHVAYMLGVHVWHSDLQQRATQGFHSPQFESVPHCLLGPRSTEWPSSENLRRSTQPCDLQQLAGVHGTERKTTSGTKSRISHLKMLEQKASLAAVAGFVQ